MNALRDLTLAKWRKHMVKAKQVNKAKPENTPAAFCSLEAELAELWRADHTTKEVAAKADLRKAEVEERIKGICDQANPAEPAFSKRFIDQLRKRFCSSGDFADYARERDRLLVRLGEKSVKSRTALARGGRSTKSQDGDKKIAELAETLRKRRPRLSLRSLAAELSKDVGLKRNTVEKKLARLAKTWTTEQSSMPTTPTKK
jgi:uncharacterized protein YjiS (DUF1127 family)